MAGTISHKPTSSPYQRLNHPRLFQTAWFPILIILFFGMACIFAVDIFYRFLSSEFQTGWFEELSRVDLAYLAYPGFLKVMALKYCKLTGFCVFILVIFISICLTIQSKWFSLPARFVRWKKFFENLDLKKQIIIQRISWILLIFLLLGGIFSFDWYMLF